MPRYALPSSSRGLVCAVAMGACTLLLVQDAAAHWCNNIFTAPARLVVKPETPTVHITAGSPATLKVYLRNNFPYTLFDTEMRGEASGYTIQASAGQTIHPGQNATYTLTISGGAGDVAVTQLNLQVRFRGTSAPFGWQDKDDCRMDENPSQALLAARSIWSAKGSSNNCGSNQSASLSAATLADLFPAATLKSSSPGFGRTGIEQLISFFGYRFCYSSGGSWRSGSQDCPSAAAEGSAWSSTQQFGQNCMRAGVELAVRKDKLGAKLADAKAGAINALKGGSGEHRCLAAVVGAYLHKGASATAFTAALSGLPTPCQSAAHRILDGSKASGCTSGSFYEKAACAAAEGMNGNDAVVKSVLLANAGDGAQGGYESLYHAYMVKLVVAERWASAGKVTFLPDNGGPPPPGVTPPQQDSGVPPAKDGGVTPPTKDGGVTPPAKDSGVSPLVDGGSTPPAKADGGCAFVAGSADTPLGLALLLLLGLAMIRRR